MRKGSSMKQRLQQLVAAATTACMLVAPATALADQTTNAAEPLQAQATWYYNDMSLNSSYVTVTLDKTTYNYTGSEIKPKVSAYMDVYYLYDWYGDYYYPTYNSYDNWLYDGLLTDYVYDTYSYDISYDDFYSYLVDSYIDDYSLILDPYDSRGYVRTLTEGVDYYVTYSNNVNPGTATATIHGMNGLTGTKSINFTITNNGSGSTTGKSKRLAGADRYETMNAIVNEGFTSSATAIIANGGNYPDALSASALAGTSNAPVILTDTNTLSPQASNQLRRLGVREVIIMGGEAAVSYNVKQTLESMGLSVYRVNGLDRVETSIKALDLAYERGCNSDTIIITTGNNFADSLSISPYSWVKHAPVVLTQGNGLLSEGTLAVLRNRPEIGKAIIVGGGNAVSYDVENVQLASLGIPTQRIAGNDRYQTSEQIANFELSAGIGFNWRNPIVSRGDNFPDALAGGPLAGRFGSVLLLANNTYDATISLMRSNANAIGNQYYVLGGVNAVSNNLTNYIDQFLPR